MTEREYEEKRILLNQYRDTVRRLERRTQEAARWNELAGRMPGGIASARRRPGGEPSDPGAAKSVALSIEDECRQLAVEASCQRDRLTRCLARVRSDSSREVLESVYLNGKTVEQVALELDRSVKTIRRHLRSATVRLDECSDFFRAH